MNWIRQFLRWGIPLGLAGALVGLCGLNRPQVSGSLLDLIGDAAAKVPRFVRESSAREIAIVVASTNALDAGEVAARIAAAIGGASDAAAPLDSALEFIRENRAGLVTPESAILLESEAGRAKLVRRAMKRMYVSPVPPLLGYADDPFGLTDEFIKTLMPKPTARTAAGLPVVVTNGFAHVLVRHRLPSAIADNLNATIQHVATLESQARELAPHGVYVRFAGSPVHTAVAAARSKIEIGALTWFSLAVIAALALLAFHSWRWLPLLASSLLVSALAGALALVVGFREIHVMTLVMGTTVLGLVIDYSFHWLLAPAAAKPSVKRGLAMSFATTEISLVPLMCASIPVLRQSAVFLGVGLAAALAYVLEAYPRDSFAASHAPRRRTPAFRGPLVALLALFAAVAGLGLFRVTVRTEMGSLYRPSAELVAAERERALFGTFDFSRFPSFARRRQIAAQVENLYAEHGAELAEVLGHPALVPPAAAQDLLLSPRTLIDSIFRLWTDEALKRLAISIAILLLLLVVCCRGRAFRILLPSVAAILVVAGLLGWFNIPVNLFHILASFLLLGMGIDYAVFLTSGERSAFKPAVCSLLTSVAGFGALFFVSFPVIQSFGLVLGLGLPLAFFCALTLGTDPKILGTDPNEHAANWLGMEILYYLYCFCGLKALHWLAAAVGVLAWMFSPAVRRASPSLGKVVNFTRSLADKLVVMAEGRHLPVVEADSSPDATAFVADVQSRKGVFVLSSHVGTIEVLTAMGKCNCTFHAWMDFDRTSVFNRFYLRHARRRQVVIHPISEFGMQTVFEAGDLIDGGDCLLMAGDRGDGAFRFAAAFDHPVYFVACLAERGNRYHAVIRRLPSDRRAMKEAYDGMLQDLAAGNPQQNFTWQR